MRKLTFGFMVAALLLAACTSAGPDAGSSAATAVVSEDFHPSDVALLGATGRPQLVEFFAYWCITCNRMKPVVHGLEAKYAGQIDFIYLDIDDPANDAAKQRLGFRAQPQFLLLDASGEVVQEWLGPVSADEFEAAFVQVLGP